MNILNPQVLLAMAVIESLREVFPVAPGVSIAQPDRRTIETSTMKALSRLAGGEASEDDAFVITTLLTHDPVGTTDWAGPTIAYFYQEEASNIEILMERVGIESSFGIIVSPNPCHRIIQGLSILGLIKECDSGPNELVAKIVRRTMESPSFDAIDNKDAGAIGHFMIDLMKDEGLAFEEHDAFVPATVIAAGHIEAKKWSDRVLNHDDEDFVDDIINSILRDIERLY